MNLQERHDHNQAKLKQLVNLANELATQRENIMEQAMSLSGEQRLLDELIKEETNGTGGRAEKAEHGTEEKPPTNNPQHDGGDNKV